jgi:acyl carrier protein
MAIEPKLASAISAAIGVPASNLNVDSGIGETPGWDSFGHLRVILELEEAFAVRFDMDRIPELKTVSIIEKELSEMGAV